MPGAIIPDDWDETTYTCQKVIWPASVLWRAILFGQMTEPERESFWDPDSGDVDDAIAAVNAAETQTAPDFWTEDCDVIPGIPVPAFSVHKTAALVLPATTWTTVPFEVYTYEHNNPNFSLASNHHAVVAPDLRGVWHYDVTLKLTSISQIYVRLQKLPGPTTIVFMGSSSGLVNVSLDYVWALPLHTLHLEVYSVIASGLDIQPYYCIWNGHFVGPVIG